MDIDNDECRAPAYVHMGAFGPRRCDSMRCEDATPSLKDPRALPGLALWWVPRWVERLEPVMSKARAHLARRCIVIDPLHRAIISINAYLSWCRRRGASGECRRVLCQDKGTAQPSTVVSVCGSMYTIDALLRWAAVGAVAGASDGSLY